ncbi:phenol 2-monooxygenase [Bdellovibrio bacteriovorus]|uniref:Phenol 2-monooxygenase n=2 Tax=Bdellovibrio bacteriovorus TaxID=959 RepID=A0A150WV62_BDEBC|nr:FAD-binding oxidoreductase [Bdellovibrio bacteriovorus]KYG67709.1 phenol 2-monooxygenase [Bdellovibrio bacteriovorus]KYG70182.1 phenol 2-monooxygenase [Bdellovibrio bacteriovorus]
MSSARKVYHMRVTEIIDHTPTVRELVLKTEEPGEFTFKAGQFVMLNVPQGEAKPILRAYSIASDDRIKNGFRLLFKFVENGVASTFVWALKGGELINFTGPFGKVFFQEPPTEQIVFLNTGTGLSQHICYLLSKKEQYPNLRYRMLFGVRSEKDMYYQKEVEALMKELPDFKFEFVLSRPSEEWKGKKGYVQNFISEFDYKNIPTTFYLCGNGGMIKEVKHQLLEVDGFDKTRIWSEAFD